MVTREQIEAVLMRQDNVGVNAVGRALVHLKNRQTYDEQRDYRVKYQNGRGFTQGDGRSGTGMAQFFESRGYLTAKQLAYWQKSANPDNPRSKPRILKYAGQILEEALLKQGQAR